MLFKFLDNQKHIKRYPFVPKMKLHTINGHAAYVMATLLTLYRSLERKWCFTPGPGPQWCQKCCPRRAQSSGGPQKIYIGLVLKGRKPRVIGPCGAGVGLETIDRAATALLIYRYKESGQDSLKKTTDRERATGTLVSSIDRGYTNRRIVPRVARALVSASSRT